jgi:hypothetical protein
MKCKCPDCGVWFPAYEDHECKQSTSSKDKPSNLKMEQSFTPSAGNVSSNPPALSPSPAPLKMSRGRPLNSQRHLTNEAQKPWEALGMCRATWYRRQKDKQQQGDK